MLTRFSRPRSSHTPLKPTVSLYRGYHHVPSNTLRVPTSYTIAVGPNTTKKKALQALKSKVIRSPLTDKTPDLPSVTGNPNIKHSIETVIIASRSLASWLEDSSFILSLIKTNARRYKPLSQADARPEDGAEDDHELLVPPPPEMSILTAAVDSIPLPVRQQNRGWGNGLSTQGISVIQKNSYGLLPGLWENALASRQNDPDLSAGLVFKLPDFEGRTAEGTLEVTLPVASTVFHNGRTSTMFASRWAGSTWADYRLVEQRDVTQTTVRLQRKESDNHDASTITIPMLPLTQPRRIVSGLGNIIRQVEIATEETGRKTVPASMELEEKIPHMLSVREEMGLGPIEGPVGVWALVIPPKVAETLPVMRFLTHGLQEFDPAVHYRPLLEAGCRVYRVLSGGGGWGDKKGLLSLDPQTKFLTTDDEDIDSFARSFLGQHSDAEQTSGSGDIISPGDHVAFFVDTQTYPLRRIAEAKPRDTAESLQLCVDMPEKHNWADIPSEPTTAAPTPEVFLNYFGAASGQAMFVGPETFMDLEKPRTEQKPDSPFEDGVGYGLSPSKIDTPGTSVLVFRS